MALLQRLVNIQMDVPTVVVNVCCAVLREAKFDFDDFLKQYKMVAGMGNMGQIMKMLPGEAGQGRTPACFIMPVSGGMLFSDAECKWEIWCSGEAVQELQVNDPVHD